MNSSANREPIYDRKHLWKPTTVIGIKARVKIETFYLLYEFGRKYLLAMTGKP
jgi:hypothetical protein